MVVEKDGELERVREPETKLMLANMPPRLFDDHERSWQPS